MRSYRYLVGMLVIVVLFILAFLFLTRPSGTGKPVAKINLSDSASTNAEVSFTLEGVTNAEPTHRSIKITINNQLVNLTVFGGYQGSVVKSESFQNNTNAFSEFLSGIESQGFIKQRKISPDLTPYNICPLSIKYEFSTSRVENVPAYLWSCSNGSGSFAGNRTNIARLFQLQVPNYEQYTSDINL